MSGSGPDNVLVADLFTGPAAWMGVEMNRNREIKRKEMGKTDELGFHLIR